MIKFSTSTLWTSCKVQREIRKISGIWTGCSCQHMIYSSYRTGQVALWRKAPFTGETGGQNLSHVLLEMSSSCLARSWYAGPSRSNTEGSPPGINWSKVKFCAEQEEHPKNLCWMVYTNFSETRLTIVRSPRAQATFNFYSGGKFSPIH